jgi:hypothetical protein
LRFWNVVAVIVGPILAIFLGHVFGAALGARVALGRPLTPHEHRRVFADGCRFLLIAVPPQRHSGKSKAANSPGAGNPVIVTTEAPASVSTMSPNGTCRPELSGRYAATAG